MAGHWRGTGGQTRTAGRIAEHKRRVQEAPTGRAQVAAAFDRLRSAAARVPGDQDRLWRDLATELNERARELEAAA